ncbi:MAG: HDOD domain-containing protein [Desulfamplus sp.]|nr:HDOD domain-containing protein [Desulfamplus sp.]
MIDTFYRIVLKKCGKKENLKALSRFIVKEFNLSDENADFIVHNPPAILGDMNNQDNAELALKHLDVLDADCVISTIIKDKRLPFSIKQKQLKWISKEFSKTLRACVETTLFYVTVEPSKADMYLPSLIGKKDELEDTFRYSDSLFVIDDSSFILLGFASDRDGSDVVFDKIVNFMENNIHKDINVYIGMSIIPEDGKSFYDLIAVAKKNLFSFKKDVIGLAQKIEVVQQDNSEPRKKDVSLSDIQVFTLCFNKARGKFYNDLTALPPDVLWGALSRIPISDQKKFFLKLPHDSHLTPFLAEKIKTQSEYADVETARKKVRRVISEMQLVENLKERSLNQKHIVANLKHVDSMFNIPDVALQVYKVASDPESDIDDIVSNIMIDPSLSMKILKIVNSPFYRRAGQMNSIKDAVLILGRDEIVNMAFGLSLSKSFLDADLKGLIDPLTLWKHSMETAFISRYLCESIPDFKNFGAFTAGLLHDLGKVYLIENFSELYGLVLNRAEEHEILTGSIEQELLGMDHGGIGRMIGEHWNLPAPLVQAIGFHHQPSGAPDYSTFAAIVGFADYLVNMASVAQEIRNARLKQLFKVDHMIMMKKLFSDFGSKFIESAFEETLKLLDESAETLKNIGLE